MPEYDSYRASVREDMDPAVKSRLEDYDMMLAAGLSPDEAWAAIEPMDYADD